MPVDHTVNDSDLL